MRNILFSAALVMSLLYPALSASEDYRELAFASGLSAEVEVVQEREREDRVALPVALGAVAAVGAVILAEYVNNKPRDEEWVSDEHLDQYRRGYREVLSRTDSGDHYHNVWQGNHWDQRFISPAAFNKLLDTHHYNHYDGPDHRLGNNLDGSSRTIIGAATFAATSTFFHWLLNR